jgi:hypothetical protein
MSPDGTDRRSGGTAWRLFDRLTEEQRRRLVDPVHGGETAGGGPQWCCAACRSPVTTREASVAVAGRHVHRRTNPDGLAFVFGCFRQAAGGASIGVASDYWSWFSGYRWRVVLCRQCGTQLGWHFSGADAFFGLILERLVECGRPSS